MNLPKKKSSILTRCPYCEKKIGLDTTKPVLDSEGMKQLADEIESRSSITNLEPTVVRFGEGNFNELIKFLRGE